MCTTLRGFFAGVTNVRMRLLPGVFGEWPAHGGSMSVPAGFGIYFRLTSRALIRTRSRAAGLSHVRVS